MPLQTFFIPKKISELRLSKVPLSPSLLKVLNKLEVKTFGDLSGLVIKDFYRISNKGGTLFAELTGLTQAARNGDFDSILGQNRPLVMPVVEKNGNTESIASHSKTSDDECSFVPQEVRGMPISAFRLSVRLRHVLGRKGFRILGDIHGLSYAAFGEFANCGKKTVAEFRELIRQVQRAQPVSQAITIPVRVSEPFAVLVGDCLCVPANVRDLKFCDLNISVRLENVLKKQNVTRLGELSGISVIELQDSKNCGRKTISEIVSLIENAAAGHFKTITDANVRWSPVELIEFLDALVSELAVRDVEILEMRLSGEEEPLTLGDVGEKFKVTREAIRQVVKKTKAKLRKAGSRRLSAYLLQAEKICREAVCPLTPELLRQWLFEKEKPQKFSNSFYVRLLCELNPAIPTWHSRPEAPPNKKKKVKIEKALQTILREDFRTLVLSEAYSRTAAQMGAFQVVEFFDVLRSGRQFRVDFEKPDCPTVRLARLPAADLAHKILLHSDKSLTPEEILTQAAAKFGQEISKLNPNSLGNVLTEEKGFYLLGPRAYGLRRHFTLPESLWPRIRSDFETMLKREAHPISTSDVINNQRFEWARKVNAYELACVLRADNHFVDLGKFLFSLAKWGIQEREYVKDLVPKILEQVGRPLTGLEVLARLQKLRSVSPFAISGHLRKHPQLHDYGFGHYGLKSWGESAYGKIATDSALIERVIKRAEPPLKLGRLSEILNFTPGGDLMDKLWQTCAAMPTILRMPDERSVDTRLIHRTCRFEHALIATAREVNRPLPLYEFQWELNERFGPLFAKKTLDDLRRCLEQSPMFLRNADEEFILDIHLEQLGLDAAAIRTACSELLSQTNEIVGCEDLLERLEADGKSWENLSADILASLLRDDDGFQEVGHDRFRAKICKH